MVWVSLRFARFSRRSAGRRRAKSSADRPFRRRFGSRTWTDDPATKAWLAYLDKYLPDANKGNHNSVYCYAVAQTMVQVLKPRGDELTREDAIKQAANLKNFSTDMMLRGIIINTGPDDDIVLKRTVRRDYHFRTSSVCLTLSYL